MFPDLVGGQSGVRIPVPEVFTTMNTIYRCEKTVCIVPIEGDRFRIKATLRDVVHEVTAEVELLHPSLEITDAVAEIRRGPFTEVCRITTDRMKGLIGLTIAPGFKRKAREAVGGSEGCHRLLDLVAEIATAAYQLHFVRFFAANPELTGQEDVPVERRQAALQAIPGLHNTCFVYKDGSETLVRDKATPLWSEKERGKKAT